MLVSSPRSRMCKSKIDDVPEDRIRIGNKLYDAKKIEEWHPGGKIFIQVFTGHDATEAFVLHHRRMFPHNIPRVKEAFVREDATVSPESEEIFDDYLELSDRVAKVIPRQGGYSTIFSNLKSIFFVAVFIGMELYAHYYIYYEPLFMFFFGFWFVYIGVNIGHEGLHGSASSKPWINQLYSMGWNLTGESTLHWIHFHLVEHHTHANDPKIDPEKASGMGLTSGFLSLWNIQRVNPLDERRPRHLWQHVLFLVYNMLIYGPLVLITSFSYAITGHGTLKLSKSMWRYRITGFLVNCLIVVRLGILPCYLTGTVQNLLKTNWLFVGYGFHQGLTHIIHMFDGVHYTSMSSNTGEDEKKSFLYRHIATTCSCGGEILGWFYGGLNYHIEHHLFPRVNHIHFPKMRPIIQEFCAEKGIPYTYFPSLWDNIKSFIKHLYILGHDDSYTDKHGKKC